MLLYKGGPPAKHSNPILGILVQLFRQSNIPIYLPYGDNGGLEISSHICVMELNG